MDTIFALAKKKHFQYHVSCYPKELYSIFVPWSGEYSLSDKDAAEGVAGIMNCSSYSTVPSMSSSPYNGKSVLAKTS